jgi:hypothetical protein
MRKGMNILAKARRLEARLADTVDRAAARMLPPAAREPLEIAHGVVDAVEREVQPAGRGRHLFPFNRVVVHLAAPTRQARARIEATFAAEPTLVDRVRTRLETAGCLPEDLTVAVEFAEAASAGWLTPEFHVEFDTVAPPPAPVVTATPAAAPAPPPAIELEVVAGAAEQPSYVLQLSRIEVGRCGEVRDRRNRLVRTNHVVFADTDPALNQTVSRRHAHLDYHAGEGAYRVYDDGSEQGTSVTRAGRTIAVPPGPRGVRLQAGDEIVLGLARLRVKTPSAQV